VEGSVGAADCMVGVVGVVVEIGAQLRHFYWCRNHVKLTTCRSVSQAPCGRLHTSDGTYLV